MIDELRALRLLILRRKGGPGSGHRGHAGRPGQRGGSLPGSSGVVAAGIDKVMNGMSYEDVRTVASDALGLAEYELDISYGKNALPRMIEDTMDALARGAIYDDPNADTEMQVEEFLALSGMLTEDGTLDDLSAFRLPDELVQE